MRSNDFERGVDWCKFTVGIPDDGPLDDMHILAAVDSLIEHPDSHPDHAVMDALLDSRYGSIKR